jgi:RNA polymerase sigma-70 factor (ECF subfamily)
MWDRFKAAPIGDTGVTKHQNLHLSSEGAGESSSEYVPLVRRAAAGDREAMERLLMRAQEVAFRFSFLVCGHPQDAEDVMQDALLKTYRYVNRIRDPEAFRAWLYRTVRNACLMKRRRRAGEPAHFASIEQGESGHDGEPVEIDVEDTSMRPDDLALNEWVGERLRAALMSLPPPYRIIVVLREMEGLSTREVAAVTRISEANVKARLHRARVLLRKNLEGV